MVVHTGVKGIPSAVSTLRVLDVGVPVPFFVVWMSGDLYFGFFGDD